VVVAVLSRGSRGNSDGCGGRMFHDRPKNSPKRVPDHLSLIAGG
jgi:hypothetical protein